MLKYTIIQSDKSNTDRRKKNYLRGIRAVGRNV